ncbi:MerR family transcriptional regulator [Bowmanella denitrificans]|uniref:MerR family transcriptional regulator n=1 Tax=Bowmanella denitrificans TaxID=366582 RepID=UPI000C9BC317|nr:MerR family transcriptional regulator [Bowmanella denitrificans]
MNIKEFAEVTGLSAHTLRYYEKIGLLKNVQRSSSGHRFYTGKDAEWIGFILRLKETGMALEAILQYAQLREQGASTAPLRQAMLEEHQANLKAYIARQQQHMAVLEHKIWLYKNQKVS